MHGNMFIDIVSTNVKILHHLGEESYNLNKLNNNIENKLSSIQKEHFNRGGQMSCMLSLTRMSNHLETIMCRYF